MHGRYYEENGEVFRTSDGLPMVIDGACIVGGPQGFQDWFRMDDWFFCPNNDDRICKMDHTWYNIDQAWRAMNHSSFSNDDAEHWKCIFNALLHGMLFNDEYKVCLMDTQFRVRVEASVRDLIHDSLEAHKIPTTVANHYLTLIRDFGHTFTTRSYEDDFSIDTIEVDSLLDEDIDELFNPETFFDDVTVIDLTGGDN